MTHMELPLAELEIYRRVKVVGGMHHCSKSDEWPMEEGKDYKDKKKQKQSKTDKERKRQDKSEETAKDQSRISPTQQERQSKVNIIKPRTKNDKFSKSQGLI
ncbi:hypothetical protein Tco_0020329 [Tanacetum coccineum]